MIRQCSGNCDNVVPLQEAGLLSARIVRAHVVCTSV